MKSLISSLIGLVLSVSVGADPLIEGRVRLDSGEPVAEAQVRIFDMTDPRRGAIARATTNGTGYFALPLAALTGNALPEGFTLGQNYPNPFNPSTIIPYQLAASSEVRLEVFNLLGQHIATLVDGERPAGFHTATWHATDAAGRAVGAGVYIYRLIGGGQTMSRRMVLVDGQAGVPRGEAGVERLSPVISSWEVDSRVYRLTVSGQGLVPYVDPTFRVEAGMAPVELVVETLGLDPASKATDDATPVTIPDANLRAAIAAALGKASGATITQAEMATLGRLEAPDAGISDLTGLEFATNLTFLVLLNNQITDISPLDGLTNLTELVLYGNQVADISPLDGLTNLTWLSLAENRITDISPLDGLTNLTSLGLAGNNITGISPLDGLTNLTSLGLAGNNITDISPLDGLTNLTKLYIGSNRITDISALASLTNLTHLYIENNRITDVSALASLTNLTHLYIGNNRITDISALASLTNLTELTLNDNLLSVSSINDHIPVLQDRGVTVEFDPTPYDPTPVTIPDANLRAAIAAALDKASDATITKGEMTTLVRLDASDAGISDLTGLEFATNLTDLGLDHNNITDISALAGLTNLTSLGLDANPLNASSINDHIPVLQARGVTVEFDPIPATVTDDPTPVTIPDVNLRAAIAAALGKASDATITKGEMTTLVRLEARDAGIGFLTGLEFATNLTDLTLYYNQITDLSALAGLTNLTELRLAYNQITDLSALAGLTNLTELELRHNRITDISPLAGLTNLTGLRLTGNQITDISPLDGLTNLTGLGLSNNNITGISPLAGLTNLTGLGLRHNRITDISPLAGLTNLESLGLIESCKYKGMFYSLSCAYLKKPLIRSLS